MHASVETNEFCCVFEGEAVKNAAEGVWGESFPPAGSGAEPQVFSEARRQFPAGLIQPEGSFRFSRDALLLSSFALECRPTPGWWVDLGTGCGVVGLAALLYAERLAADSAGLAGGAAKRVFPEGARVCGLDCDPELVEAANANAARLGLAFQAQVADVRGADWKEQAHVLRKQYGRTSLVMCNPPWRLVHAGRLPASPVRRRALFGDAETLRDFVSASADILQPEGLLVCLVGAERVADLFVALAGLHYNPVRLRLVHPRPQKPAVFALVAARRAGKASLVVESVWDDTVPADRRKKARGSVCGEYL